MNRNRSRLALPALAFLLALPAFAQEPAPPPGTGMDANKALVRRYIEEILSGGKLELLDEIVSPEFVDRTPGAPPQTRGPEVIRESQKRARELFQDIRYTLDDLIAEGDQVVARYTVRATRKPAEGSDQGKPIEVTGITIYKIADGKIAETWIVNDQIELFRQLGFTLTPPKQEPQPKPQPLPPPEPAPAGRR
ncbi:MAG TPA: ester cyclase [Thermoanaerobaculia bacterium]|nr:ester cyclase [Thermoanaerobaculia bacterium]